MAASCGKKSLKHKLTQALSSTAKKQRLSSPGPSTKQDDSGIGMSLSSKKKAGGRKTVSKTKVSAKRRLDSSVPATDTSVKVEEMDVGQILALGEGLPSSSTHNEAMTDSDQSDWEEVKDVGPKEPVIPENGVDITLDAPLISFKRKKKEFDVEGEIRRQLKRRQREIQILMHKVHLLCWVAHIKFVNTTLNSELLLTECNSLITSKNLYPPKHADLAYLERIVKAFRKQVALNEDVKEKKTEGLLQELCFQFQKKTAHSKNLLLFMFVVFLRTLGLKVRFVTSLVVVPLKPSEKQGTLIATIKKETVKSEKDKVKESPTKGSLKKNLVKNLKSVTKSDDKGAKAKEAPKESPTKGSIMKNLEKNLRSVKAEKEKSLPVKATRSTQKEGKESPTKGSMMKNVTSVEAGKEKNLPRKATRSAQKEDKALQMPKKEEKSEKLGTLVKVEKELSSTVSVQKSPALNRSTRAASRPSSSTQNEVKKTPPTSSKKQILDSDDEPLSRHFLVKKPTSKKATATKLATKLIKKEADNSDDDFSPSRPVAKKKLDRRVLSSDDEGQVVSAKKKGQDVWAEVFLEAEEKWITVDVVKQKVHCVKSLYSRATQPVVYVLACNNDSTLKDVTQRYVPHWHSDTRKKRISEKWWQESLWPYRPPPSAQETEEDEDIARQLQDMPLPTSITEYKSHPLYALKRHLLKFEAIYPPEAPTLGFVRGEPVYGRECVVTLRSREIWFKEARIVRQNETPYKIVKSRPKYDKMTGEFKKDLPLEVFGVWQTEDYIPPTAVNGKVPRNEYGNVDLFKPCMLPGGTVHLQIPALIRVARKLGIDCAPAVIGFDFHSGGSHPVHDGFVVCEEFKDELLEAWNKDIDESARRAEEKREKRVYGNWRRLIRGLLIRENLKIKYAFGENSDDESSPSSSSQTPSGSSASASYPQVPTLEPPAKKKRARFYKK